MTNANTDGVILADSVLINRIGGGIPPGNSVGQAAGLPETDPAETQGSDFDETLSNTAYWSDALEEVAIVLAEEAERDDRPDDVAGGRIDEPDERGLEAVLADWL